MVNEQIEIALSDTAHSSLMTFRQDFVSIYCELYKKAQQTTTVIPVDIVVDIDTTDYSDDDLAQVIQNELFYAQQEIQNQLSANAYIDKVARAYEDVTNTTTGSIPVVNIPFLIEVIVNHFLKQKDIEDYEKVQWKNLIVTLQNATPETEKELLSTYTNMIITYKVPLTKDDKSLQSLKFLYHKLNSHIDSLVKAGKARLPLKMNSINFDDDGFFNSYLQIAIKDLYLRDESISLDTKKFWSDFINEIITKKRNAQNIFKNPHYSELSRYVIDNLSSLKNKYKNEYDILIASLEGKYQYEEHNKSKYNRDISSANLILAIAEKYLSDDGLNREELISWLDIIENLVNGTVDVATILHDNEFTELRIFIYEDYIFRLINEELTLRIDIEKYRDVLLAEIQRFSDNWTDYHDKFNRKLLIRLENAAKMLNTGVSVFEALTKYQTLFLLLDNLIDITQFSDITKYPKITPLYNKFKASKWFKVLENKSVYGLNEFFNLDEVVVSDSDKILKLKYYHSENRRSGTSTTYYEVTANKILEFATIFIGKEISLREAAPYTKGVRLKYINNQLKLGYFNYEVKLHKKRKNLYESHAAFDTPANLNSSNFEFNFTSKNNRYQYSLYIKDNSFNNLFEFTTYDYQAIDYLFSLLNYKVNGDVLNRLIKEFVDAFIAAGTKRNQLDRLYQSIPTALYKDITGRISENGIPINSKYGIDDTKLEKDLRNILNGWVTDGGKFFDRTNEEMAVVNIIMAMTPQKVYSLLKSDTKLLYKIFEKLSNNIFVSDPAYNRFVDYLIPIILQFHNQKAEPIVWFSNQDWLFNDIEIEMNDWEGGKDITIKNYFQPYINFGNLLGKNKFLSDSEKQYHPLDLVDMQTMVGGKVESVVKVPVFFLYHKVQNKASWDTFSFVMDIVSLITVYGAARVLVAKAGMNLLKISGKQLAAGALISKEFSTKLLQNQDLTNWLELNHPEILKTWVAIDTTGDIAYILDSFTKVKDFIDRSGNALREMVSAGEKVPDKFKKWLQQAKELAEKRYKPLPETATAMMLDGIGGRIKIPLGDNRMLYGNTLSNRVDKQIEHIKSLINSSDVSKLKEDLEALIKQAKTDNAIAWLNDLESFRKTIETSGSSVYKKALMLDLLKLQKRQGSTFTAEQLRYLFALENMSGIDDVMKTRLLKYILEAPTGKFMPKEVLERFNKGLIYDVSRKSWISTNKNTKDRTKKLVESLEKNKRAPETIEKGKEVGKYGSIVNKELKQLITEASSENLEIFLKRFEVNGKPLEKYKTFYEGLKKYHKNGKISTKELQKLMENYRRHHIFTVGIFEKNLVFQETYEWGLKHGKDLGFNNFRKNIIILHKDQHGVHKEFTDRIRRRIQKEIAPVIKVKTDINYKKAYQELENILQDEISNIFDDVIKKVEGHLNKTSTKIKN